MPFSLAQESQTRGLALPQSGLRVKGARIRSHGMRAALTSHSPCLIGAYDVDPKLKRSHTTKHETWQLQAGLPEV